jgi:hypothetical protein
LNNDSGGGLVTSRASGCYTANSSSSDSHDLKDEKEEETTATEEGKKDGSSRVLSSPPLDSSNNDEIVCFVKRFDINVDSSSFLADRRLDKILKRYMKQNSLCHIAAVGTEWVNDDLINIFISVMTLLLYPKDKNSLLFPTTFLNEFETQKKIGIIKLGLVLCLKTWKKSAENNAILIRNWKTENGFFRTV